MPTRGSSRATTPQRGGDQGNQGQQQGTQPPDLQTLQTEFATLQASFAQLQSQYQALQQQQQSQGNQGRNRRFAKTPAKHNTCFLDFEKKADYNTYKAATQSLYQEPAHRCDLDPAKFSDLSEQGVWQRADF